VKALVLSPARLREPSLVERFDYYRKLLRSQLPLDQRFVKKGNLAGHAPEGWHVVALDERGEALTSMQFADRVARLAREGCPGIAFFVGAADGLDKADLERADSRLRLSSFTLPHQLCFVLIAEQLYRATSIARGGRYHRA